MTLQTIIDRFWDEAGIKALSQYITIPCLSPAFDPDWEAQGALDKAVDFFIDFAKKHAPIGMQIEKWQLPKRTPVIWMHIPGTAPGRILMYSHLDKQPPMTGWRAGLSAFSPVIEGDKLYGRGASDDGYAFFAALAAIKAVQESGLTHPDITLIVEASEESGSSDLPAYVSHYKQRLGTPDFVICLDSGAGNYEQLWNTVSLRGMCNMQLTVKVLNEGIHSGSASNVVPGSFRILRQLLDRIELSKTGELLVKEAHGDIPLERQAQTKKAAQKLGADFFEAFRFEENMLPANPDVFEAMLARTWKPSLTVVGVDGLPSIETGGNVLRPFTTLNLSFRFPPTCDSQKAVLAIKQLLEAEPPYGASISVTIGGEATDGWNAKKLSPALEGLYQEASQIYFGQDVLHMGEGGTIPFMGYLGKEFPSAQFLVTGVLGPESNAHGPNEFLHIPYTKKLTACIAHIIGHCALVITGGDH